MCVVNFCEASGVFAQFSKLCEAFSLVANDALVNIAKLALSVQSLCRSVPDVLVIEVELEILGEIRVFGIMC